MKEKVSDEVMESKKCQSGKTGKRHYLSPHLLVLGSIQSHTAGGSDPGREGTGKGNQMKRL